MIDYSKGRYLVKNVAGQLVGQIDNDEYVRNGLSLLYRIDGAEFYSCDGTLIGFLDGGRVRSSAGELLFHIHSE